MIDACKHEFKSNEHNASLEPVAGIEVEKLMDSLVTNNK